MRLFFCFVVAVTLLVSPLTVWSQDKPLQDKPFRLLIPVETDGVTDTLTEAVFRAIVSNPDIMANCQAFKAATREQHAARGDYLPSIDLSARVGYEGYRSNSITSDYQPGEASLGLTQMIYDGFATKNEVARLDAEKLVRFYLLLESFENTALEVVTAYLDVLRYRNLLAYAEENLQHHEEIYQQVAERVRVGVGRGVDLDQATGRLALARANRMTEANNLHDVSSRFLRIVGELPEDSLQPPVSVAVFELPTQVNDALLKAFQDSPVISAAFERVAAAEKARDVRKASFQPQLDLRAHHEVGADRDHITGNSNETVVELVANLNLFRGGSDSETVKQFTHKMNQAIYLRERVCRDVRQNLTIAMSDIDHLKVQLTYLKDHQQSSAKAREAYRNQFDIGQRTLLDLLDTENEYFQARRAYTIASYDYIQARARSAASMGWLLVSLGLRNEELSKLSFISSERDANAVTNFCLPQGVPTGLYRDGEISPQPWLK